jgi:TolB protein
MRPRVLVRRRMPGRMVLAAVAVGLAVANLVLVATPGARASLARTSLDAPAARTCDPTSPPCFRLESTIAFTTTRDNPTVNPAFSFEIYLMNPDGTNARRLTDNNYGDAFPVLSWDGKKIVFDSNRLTAATGTLNISDLFLMNTDGTEQTLLTRGSSATWSPDSKTIAFHASASYYASGGLASGTPIRTDVGSATSDSDLFVANVDDLANAVDVLAKTKHATNITNTPDQIEDDADWSTSPTSAPDGQRIVFTSHPVTDRPNPSNQAEIYVMDPDGSKRLQLTHNDYEERAPAWSPDGTRILFNCRIDGGTTTFELCVMNADGTGLVQLTDNSVPDLTATWSPDGQQIVFHRTVAGQGAQLFTMHPALNPDGTLPTATQVTFPPGLNVLANWGELRVLDPDATQ